MISKLKNLTPMGLQFVAPFFKKVISENLDGTLTPIDGYQIAVISLNLPTYMKLVETDNEITEEQASFMTSIDLILKDQADVIEKVYKEFRTDFAEEMEASIEDSDMGELDHYLSKVYIDPSFRY